ncbi:MAG: hypothetical protein E7277_08295 [Lachnospiraceae bacterium]|nr:hypothetical protein [Lachnospiraceae bacterium]
MIISGCAKQITVTYEGRKIKLSKAESEQVVACFLPDPQEDFSIGLYDYDTENWVEVDFGNGNKALVSDKEPLVLVGVYYRKMIQDRHDKLNDLLSKIIENNERNGTGQ